MTLSPLTPSGADLVWRACRFDELDVHQLQAIHRARQRVFVVEQACAFLDADDQDERAIHLAAWSSSGAEPLAYARLLAPGAKYVEASIGRVLTAASVRGRGLGRELFRRAVVHAGAAWPRCALRISAQSRLEVFYADFGFARMGAPYLEDGILHTDMLLVPTAS